jgi:hypothetical protein
MLSVSAIREIGREEDATAARRDVMTYLHAATTRRRRRAGTTLPLRRAGTTLPLRRVVTTRHPDGRAPRRLLLPEERSRLAATTRLLRESTLLRRQPEERIRRLDVNSRRHEGKIRLRAVKIRRHGGMMPHPDGKTQEREVKSEAPVPALATELEESERITSAGSTATATTAECSNRRDPAAIRDALRRIETEDRTGHRTERKEIAGSTATATTPAFWSRIPSGAIPADPVLIPETAPDATETQTATTQSIAPRAGCAATITGAILASIARVVMTAASPPIEIGREISSHAPTRDAAMKTD